MPASHSVACDGTACGPHSHGGLAGSVNSELLVATAVAKHQLSGSLAVLLAVLNMIFNFVLAPGGPGGGSGLPFS